MAKTKVSMQKELDDLLTRAKSLKEEMEQTSKFTVSTRKERSRRNEMTSENNQLQEKIKQLSNALKKS